ncbi:RNMT-activating mRNA cap methyltransferase subunit-like [Ctenocephalides felis]|uniref:RNMT-activating mRNA cap methyltransferase subunit-like n=1 Tax=Ctenocephalides felis TaxID=7515 RepID=UPI000E6E5408|nr:RNMT-activating mRNA cap methyltransferase subunit-like [Ctenocephalides felis]
MVDPHRKINNLTEEHRAFLAECEQEFADRYTENDPEFKTYLEKKPSVPPIVDPWQGSQKRTYDNHRGGRGRGYFRHRGGGGRYNNNRDGGGGGYHRQNNYQGDNYNNHRGGGGGGFGGYYRRNPHGNKFYGDRNRPY